MNQSLQRDETIILDQEVNTTLLDSNDFIRFNEGIQHLGTLINDQNFKQEFVDIYNEIFNRDNQNEVNIIDFVIVILQSQNIGIDDIQFYQVDTVNNTYFDFLSPQSRPSRMNDFYNYQAQPNQIYIKIINRQKRNFIFYLVINFRLADNPEIEAFNLQSIFSRNFGTDNNDNINFSNENEYFLYIEDDVDSIIFNMLIGLLNQPSDVRRQNIAELFNSIKNENINISYINNFNQGAFINLNQTDNGFYINMFTKNEFSHITFHRDTNVDSRIHFKYGNNRIYNNFPTNKIDYQIKLIDFNYSFNIEELIKIVPKTTDNITLTNYCFQNTNPHLCVLIDRFMRVISRRLTAFLFPRNVQNNNRIWNIVGPNLNSNNTIINFIINTVRLRPQFFEIIQERPFQFTLNENIRLNYVLPIATYTLNYNQDLNINIIEISSENNHITQSYILNETFEREFNRVYKEISLINFNQNINQNNNQNVEEFVDRTRLVLTDLIFFNNRENNYNKYLYVLQYLENQMRRDNNQRNENIEDDGNIYSIEWENNIEIIFTTNENRMDNGYIMDNENRIGIETDKVQLNIDGQIIYYYIDYIYYYNSLINGFNQFLPLDNNSLAIPYQDSNSKYLVNNILLQIFHQSNLDYAYTFSLSNPIIYTPYRYFGNYDVSGNPLGVGKIEYENSYYCIGSWRNNGTSIRTYYDDNDDFLFKGYWTAENIPFILTIFNDNEQINNDGMKRRLLELKCQDNNHYYSLPNLIFNYTPFIGNFNINDPENLLANINPIIKHSRQFTIMIEPYTSKINIYINSCYNEETEDNIIYEMDLNTRKFISKENANYDNFNYFIENYQEIFNTLNGIIDYPSSIYIEGLIREDEFFDTEEFIQLSNNKNFYYRKNYFTRIVYLTRLPQFNEIYFGDYQRIFYNNRWFETKEFIIENGLNIPDFNTMFTTIKKSYTINQEQKNFLIKANNEQISRGRIYYLLDENSFLELRNFEKTNDTIKFSFSYEDFMRLFTDVSRNDGDLYFLNFLNGWKNDADDNFFNTIRFSDDLDDTELNRGNIIRITDEMIALRENPFTVNVYSRTDSLRSIYGIENLDLVNNYYIILKNQNDNSLLEYWFRNSRDNYEMFKRFDHKTKISFNNSPNKYIIKQRFTDDGHVIGQLYLINNEINVEPISNYEIQNNSINFDSYTDINIFNDTIENNNFLKFLKDWKEYQNTNGFLNNYFLNFDEINIEDRIIRKEHMTINNGNFLIEPEILHLRSQKIHLSTSIFYIKEGSLYYSDGNNLVLISKYRIENQNLSFERYQRLGEVLRLYIDDNSKFIDFVKAWRSEVDPNRNTNFNFNKIQFNNRYLEKNEIIELINRKIYLVRFNNPENGLIGGKIRIRLLDSEIKDISRFTISQDTQSISIRIRGIRTIRDLMRHSDRRYIFEFLNHMQNERRDIFQSNLSVGNATIRGEEALNNRFERSYNNKIMFYRNNDEPFRRIFLSRQIEENNLEEYLEKIYYDKFQIIEFNGQDHGTFDLFQRFENLRERYKTYYFTQQRQLGTRVYYIKKNNKEGKIFSDLNNDEDSLNFRLFNNWEPARPGEYLINFNINLSSFIEYFTRDNVSGKIDTLFNLISTWYQNNNDGDDFFYFNKIRMMIDGHPVTEDMNFMWYDLTREDIINLDNNIFTLQVNDFTKYDTFRITFIKNINEVGFESINYENYQKIYYQNTYYETREFLDRYYPDNDLSQLKTSQLIRYGYDTFYIIKSSNTNGIRDGTLYDLEATKPTIRFDERDKIIDFERDGDYILIKNINNWYSLFNSKFEKDKYSPGFDPNNDKIHRFRSLLYRWKHYHRDGNYKHEFFNFNEIRIDNSDVFSIEKENFNIDNDYVYITNERTLYLRDYGFDRMEFEKIQWKFGNIEKIYLGDQEITISKLNSIVRSKISNHLNQKLPSLERQRSFYVKRQERNRRKLVMEELIGQQQQKQKKREERERKEREER